LAQPKTINKMKKNILIFGAILGTILCVNMVVMINLMMSNPDFEGNDLLGYIAMVVVFSLIYFGVRNYRNKQLDGYITFGKAFKTGFLIALLASTMYVVTWLFYYYLFVPDFLDYYIDYVLKLTPESDLADKTRQMENFREMYENPLFVVLVTYAEVLPVGLIITLISSFALKKKKKSNN
jgi:amino acid transporter